MSAIAPFNQSTLTMSSREIADLCETRHNQVAETIQRLFASGVLRESRKTTRRVKPIGGGRPMEVYDLTKRDTLVVVSAYSDVIYSDVIRARIIDRWIELESHGHISDFGLLPDFSDPVAAARAWADEREAKQIAELTKAEIGSRREATAMNTASQAVKRADKLAIELDRSQIFDANYGAVKAYHADVWREVYAI